MFSTNRPACQIWRGDKVWIVHVPRLSKKPVSTSTGQKSEEGVDKRKEWGVGKEGDRESGTKNDNV